MVIGYEILLDAYPRLVQPVVYMEYLKCCHAALHVYCRRPERWGRREIGVVMGHAFKRVTLWSCISVDLAVRDLSSIFVLPEGFLCAAPESVVKL
jgi:hypothetical protein